MTKPFRTRRDKLTGEVKVIGKASKLECGYAYWNSGEDRYIACAVGTAPARYLSLDAALTHVYVIGHTAALERESERAHLAATRHRYA